MREVFFSGLKGQPNWVLTASFPESAKELSTEWPLSTRRRPRPSCARRAIRAASNPVTSFTLQPYDKIAVLLADDLRKVGIDASVQILERAGLPRGPRRRYAARGAHRGDEPADPDQPLWNLLHSSSFPPGLNTARYAGIDELLAARRSSWTAASGSPSTGRSR